MKYSKIHCKNMKICLFKMYTYKCTFHKHKQRKLAGRLKKREKNKFVVIKNS